MSDGHANCWFRQARPAHCGWNLAKTAGQTALFWLLFLWAFPVALTEMQKQIGVSLFTFTLQSVLSWALFAAAGAVGLWSGATMAVVGQGTPLPVDCPRRLVIVGPYAFVRNPMAIAGLTQGAAAGLLLGSWSVLLYTLAGAVLWNTCVRPIEEQHLARLFGDEYRSYRDAVWCWIPRWRPFRISRRP